MQNGTATLGDSLVASHNIKYILTIWSSNCPSWIYSQELKMYVCIKNHTQMFIAALLIITQTEATKMSSSRWVDKQTVAHSDVGICSDTLFKFSFPSRHDRPASASSASVFIFVLTPWHFGGLPCFLFCFFVFFLFKLPPTVEIGRAPLEC